MQKVVAPRYYLILDLVSYFLLRCYIYFMENYRLLKITEKQSLDIPQSKQPMFNMLAHGPFHDGFPQVDHKDSELLSESQGLAWLLKMFEKHKQIINSFCGYWIQFQSIIREV